MKNYVQSDDNITVTAPYNVASGAGCLVGSLFGVAQMDALSGAPVTIVTEDCYDLPKKAGDTPAQGAKVYWDDTNKYVTTTTTSNTLIGCAIKAAASGDATVRVRLNGSVA